MVSYLRMGSSVADDSAVNSYEKQLYTVFKTFDVNNAEALDRTAVHALCDSLQLEDRGAALINTLFERRADRVTFAQFRNALLALLGGEPPLSNRLSDEESSGCELAPRFVFGTKKYGRRSRPQRSPDSVSAPRSSSASRLDSDESRGRPRAQLGRSASAVDARAYSEDTCPPRLDPERRIDRAGALALCRSLSMDGVDGLVERIFEDAPESDPTVGEFFGRLNDALATTIDESRDPDVSASSVAPDGIDDEAASGVPTDLIVETWERAGVPRPRALLQELGFNRSTLRPPDLERVLDDEVRALPTPGRERALLLVAALSTSRLRAQLARRRAEAATAERDKLRADVTEANARARLLAQEVDENHARIESELKASLRRAEVRHAEGVRAAAAQAVAERERATAAELRVEVETVRFAEAESRLRAESEQLRTHAAEADVRVALAEDRIANLQREHVRIAAEVSVTCKEDTIVTEGVGQCGGELVTRLESLRKENEKLRDRNDELVAELEGQAIPRGCGVYLEVTGGDLSAELADLLPSCQTEECESCPVSLEPISSETEVTVSGETEYETCYTRRYIVPAKALVLAECSSQTDYCGIQEPDLTLQQRLEETQVAHQEERCRLEAIVKELETGLDQMKSEYERCEEYWSRKLEEERSLHAEELRAGDERLAELLARVRDYDTQYARSLPTIDEKYSLELQVTDLEEEFSQYRRDKENELAEHEREVQRLKERLAAYERRRHHQQQQVVGEGSAGGMQTGAGVGTGEVRDLRARTARAEVAVRRLHARLAAADLLVKELYVENCNLAHRNHL